MKRLVMAGVMLLLAITACGDPSSAPTESTTTNDPSTTSEANRTTTSDQSDACSPDRGAWFAPGQLTIATGDPVFPPWMLDDDPTNGQGYESAVAYALASELGFAAADVVWVRTAFDEAIAPGSKSYDFNMQQYSITEERDEVVDFSRAYYETQRAVIALADTTAAAARTLADLANVELGATIGTTDLDYIERVIGVSDAAVYNTQADTISALQAGHIEATVVGLPTAYYLTAVEIPEAVIVGVLPDAGDTGEGMGLLFEDGSPLVGCVNRALDAMWADGTIDGFVEEWLQQDGSIPEISE